MEVMIFANTNPHTNLLISVDLKQKRDLADLWDFPIEDHKAKSTIVFI